MWNAEARAVDLIDRVKADDERLDLTYKNGLQLESDADRLFFRFCLGHSIMQYYLERSLEVAPQWAIKARGSKIAPAVVRRLARAVMPIDADMQLQMMLKLRYGAGYYRNEQYPSFDMAANRFATAVECAGADLVTIATRPNERGLRSLSFTRPVVDSWLGQWQESISEVYAGSVASRNTVNFLLESTGLNVK